MAIDYFGDKINARYQHLFENPTPLGAMKPISEAYAADFATWFDQHLIPMVDRNELCYGAEQISSEALPENWIRIIRLPRTYLVDLSHRVDLYDSHGKLLQPVDRVIRPPDGTDSVVAKGGYIKTPMQLEAVTGIIKKQYGYELSENILHRLVDFHKDEPFTS
jgi:hypothetical protein